MNRSRKISVVVDNPSWIIPYCERLIEMLNANGDEAGLCRDHHEIPEGDVAFFLGCIKLTPPEILDKNKRNLIVHESDLPKGRGFSPLTWQILEGRNEIPVCLLDAASEADTGDVIYRDMVSFEGHELISEMREVLGTKTVELCARFLDEKRQPGGTPQQGDPTWCSRRYPVDSMLSLDKTLKEQFNLLRVADNYRYPAFFECQGHLYSLSIEKMYVGPSEFSGEFSMFEGSGESRNDKTVMESASDGGKVTIREAKKTDGDRMLEWQSYDFTRRYFRSPSAPTVEEHWQWFRECLFDEDRFLNVILYNGTPAGALRLDRGKPNTLEVSILVAPEYYRRGIATAALRLARRLWPKDYLKAEVLQANAASHALFQKCGYEPQKNQVYMSYPLADRQSRRKA